MKIKVNEDNDKKYFSNPKEDKELEENKNTNSDEIIELFEE